MQIRAATSSDTTARWKPLHSVPEVQLDSMTGHTNRGKGSRGAGLDSTLKAGAALGVPYGVPGHRQVVLGSSAYGDFAL